MSTAAHIILKAVEFASEAEIRKLHGITASHSDVLKLDVILRILLTFLPESLHPRQYSTFLKELSEDSLSRLDESLDLLSAREELSGDEARQRARHIHLLPLQAYPSTSGNPTDQLTIFLINRAYRIDSETGSLPLIQELIDPFIDHSEELHSWAVSTLLPLLRLDYEYYQESTPTLSLEAFERLEGSVGVDTLLTRAVGQANTDRGEGLARDLRGIVGPWMYGDSVRKRRRLDRRRKSSSVPSLPKRESSFSEILSENSGWSYVNEWLVDLSHKTFSQAANAVKDWNGPRDADFGDWDDRIQHLDETTLQSETEDYAQAALASTYATNDSSKDTIEGSYDILMKTSKLLQLLSPPSLSPAGVGMVMTPVPHEYISSLDPAQLYHNALVLRSNVLTRPSTAATNLLYLFLVSALTLNSLGRPLCCTALANLALFGSSKDQSNEFSRLLHNIKATKGMNSESWVNVRHQLLWLRNWDHYDSERQAGQEGLTVGVFAKIDVVELEKAILKAYLNRNRAQLLISGPVLVYDLVRNTYCLSDNPPIPADQVRNEIIETAMENFDQATNGNKSRGGVKRTDDIRKAFGEDFLGVEAAGRISALVSATHSLSFYSLTLQHGIPFQPVTIRIHPDIINLVEQVLDQNAKAYTKLDDLLEIGRNFVRAGLVKSEGELSEGSCPSSEQNILKADRRIIKMAIEAALGSDDFDTAYSYIVSRLAPTETTQSTRGASVQETRRKSVQIEDDVSWRAAYQAGRYRPSNGNGPSQLRRLEQRMELLSQALLLAPASALEDILSTWRKCEDEMNIKMAEEIEEEEKWDQKGDRKIPGGFGSEEGQLSSPQRPREPTRNAMNEEAPMGLFDVARGAAAALSKTAFPLRSPNATNSSVNNASAFQQVSKGGLSPTTSEQGSLGAMDSEGRIRKRDVVSSMVTGGLASGIGWVLGAPPIRQE